MSDYTSLRLYKSTRDNLKKLTRENKAAWNDPRNLSMTQAVDALVDYAEENDLEFFSELGGGVKIQEGSS